MSLININRRTIEWTISIVLVFLILFGTHTYYFSLIAFAIFLGVVVFLKEKMILKQIIFILPMANIFKIGPGSQSFFTYIILLYVLLYFVRKRKFSSTIILLFGYFFLVELLMDSISVTRTIKFFSSIAFIWCVFEEMDVEEINIDLFKRYIFGVIIASTIGRLDSSFFKVKDYLSVQELGTRYGYGIMTRFTGLDTDPNYYAISLIVSLCLLIILYKCHEYTIVTAAIQGCIIISFALLTYSKSVFIMLVFPVIFLMIANHKRGNYLFQLILIVGIVGAVIYALSGKIEAVNIILARVSVSNTDLNGLTTGRVELWIAYLEYLSCHWLKVLFGSGIGAEYAPNVNRAVHNTYIEAVYHLGLVGTTWLVYQLKRISTKSQVHFKRNILNYSVLVCTLIMYMFLNEVFYYDSPFHILLALLVINTKLTNNVKVVKQEKSGRELIG